MKAGVVLAALAAIMLVLFVAALSPQPAEAATACRMTITVRAGDTLGGIAWRYGSSVSAIQQANGIANPNYIWVGQRLCIPGAGTIDRSNPSWSKRNAVNDSPKLYERYAGQGLRYVVQTGDTICGIAARYGLSCADLCSANTQIADFNFIRVGQILNRPAPPNW